MQSILCLQIFLHSLDPEQQLNFFFSDFRPLSPSPSSSSSLTTPNKKEKKKKDKEKRVHQSQKNSDGGDRSAFLKSVFGGARPV
jgi:hypothetical protein